MMTPFHTDLMKYSTPAAPTAHERQALHVRRQVRRAVFSAFIKKVLLHAPRFPVVAKRPRVNSQS
ncbi:hypothetical protein N8I71_10475 [Roseibacterium sp. SDUM158016]|jgi:hypothetical protein|nr:hypothetical protein [Roseibacterium sp. SDUM158016]